MLPVRRPLPALGRELRAADHQRLQGHQRLVVGGGNKVVTGQAL